MNIVKVCPRWHDRKLLIRATGANSLKPGSNIVWICRRVKGGGVEKYPGYDEPRYLSSQEAKNYHTDIVNGRHGDYLVYVVPLDDLPTVKEREQMILKVESLDFSKSQLNLI
jgi:hypothetical protein